MSRPTDRKRRPGRRPASRRLTSGPTMAPSPSAPAPTPPCPPRSPRAAAEAHLADITTGDSVSGTTLYLWGKVPTPNTRSYNTEYSVAAPAAVLLRIETANGAVNLDSMAGAAAVIAANGAVSTVAHSGSISVEAANGAIDCDVAGLDTAEAAALHSSNGRATSRRATAAPM